MEAFIRYGGSYLIKDLLLNRLSVSDARGFNDPFEFHFRKGARLSREAAQRRAEDALRRADVRDYQKLLVENGIDLKRFQKFMAEKRDDILDSIIQGDDTVTDELRQQIFTFTDESCKIICCTRDTVEDSAENAMWGYYADSHKGVRLHLSYSFYSKFTRYFPIEYHDVPPVFETDDVDKPEEMLDFALAALKTKSSAWAHEREMRLLIPISSTFVAPASANLDLSFIEMHRGDVQRIDLGIRYREASTTCGRLIKYFPGIEVYQATKCLESYSIVYNRIG